MNFGFKSTFEIHKNKLISAIQRQPHTVWLLLINLTVATTAVHLYLNNHFIPATVGSRYYGSYYVTILETGAWLLVASTVYAIVSLAIIAKVNQLRYQGSDVFIFKLFDCIRQSSVIVILLIHLSRFMPLRGRPRMNAQTGTSFSINHQLPKE